MCVCVCVCSGEGGQRAHACSRMSFQARRRKDGGFKRSGLREGDRRVGRTLRFKLQVVDEYRWLQRRKAEGRCDAPVREAATRFGVHKSLVSKWAAMEAALRRVVRGAMEAPMPPTPPPDQASPTSPQASPEGARNWVVARGANQGSSEGGLGLGSRRGTNGAFTGTDRGGGGVDRAREGREKWVECNSRLWFVWLVAVSYTGVVRNWRVSKTAVSSTKSVSTAWK